MSGDSSSSSSSPSPSPKPQGQQGEQGEKERTPEQPGGEKPGQKPEDKPGEGEVPKDPRASDDRDTENRAGQSPPGSGSERTELVDDVDRWGDLPIHVREIFRSEGGGDMPPQYRDWIETYYRRLNREK